MYLQLNFEKGSNISIIITTIHKAWMLFTVSHRRIKLRVTSKLELGWIVEIGSIRPITHFYY